MSSPLPPLPAPATGAPAAPSGEAPAIRLVARVTAITRHGPLIESADGNARWVLEGARELLPGAVLDLRPLPKSGAAQAARLVAIGDRALSPPLAVRLHPVPPAEATVRPASTPGTAPGVEVELRAVAETDRGPGAIIKARLTVATLPRLTDATMRAAGSPAVRVDVRPGAVPTPRAASAPLPAGSGAPPVTQTATDPAALPVNQAVAATLGPTPPPLVPGPSPVDAEVVGKDPLGRLLLQALGRTFRVETRLELPLGARLRLALSADLTGLQSEPRDTERVARTEPLRTLAEALATRQDGEPHGHGLRLPQATATLAARWLRLATALATAAKASPATAGVGEQAASRPSGGHSPLGLALAELGRLASEPQPGGWRVLLLPLGVDPSSCLKLCVRDDPGDQKKATARQDARPGARRAIFELELSRLGRCQLDALCAGHRFDLVVRSEAPLDAGLKREIRGLFAAGRAVAGYSGEVVFRARDLLALPDPRIGPGRRVTA